MNALKDTLIAFWNKLDPKVKYQVIWGAATYALLKLAIPLDPILEGILAGLAGAIAGYQTENAGTLLKQGDTEPLDSGGLVVPSDVNLKGRVTLG